MSKDLSALRIDRKKKHDPSGGPSGSWWTLIVLALILAIGGASYFYFSPAEPPAPPVGEKNTPLAASANPGNDAGSAPALIVSGYVVAHHKTQVGSKVMGKVAWIGVEKGDRVQKGQHLVKLDDREYRARVEEAEAALRATQARLQELEAGYRKEEIERARAELERARVERQNQETELKRLEKLLSLGVTSRKEVDDARTRLEVAEAAARVAEKNHDLMNLGARSEQIALARAEVDRSRAALQYSRVMLDATQIRAPVSGTVLQRLVETGEMVTTSFSGEMGAKTAVVVLADLTDLQVELDISQSDFKRISRDQECVMTPEAYPDRRYRCVIAEIAPEANRQKATIQVKVKVLDPDQYLRPEMSARVTFTPKDQP